MNSLVIVVVAGLVSATLALPYDIAQDENGQSFYLVPVHRERRQTTKVGISPNGVASVSHKGEIYSNDNVQVNGGAFAAKPLNPNGPLTFGGKVGVAGDSGSYLNLGASHTEGRGSDVSAQGNYNLYSFDRGNGRLDAVGSYSRHYDGPSGTRSPNYYGGLQLSYDF